MDYYVWRVDKDRWVNDHGGRAMPLSYQDAQALLQRCRNLATCREDAYYVGATYEIRIINPDGTPGTTLSDEVERSLPQQTVVAAVNDCVCRTCRNDRCSKSEKTCWKCGGAL